MRFNQTILKICLAFMCLLLNISVVGTPQDCGASFFMKEIPLTKGNVALVDDEDFEKVKNLKWWTKIYKNGNIYAASSNPKKILMHRMILGITDSKILVDHKNRNGLDNQKENLRIATRAQNNSNRISKPGSTSKYLGVSLSKKGTWLSCTSLKNKTVYIGHFNSEEEAAIAYNKKVIELKGEFASLNKI